jgi:hypothetical protein
MLMATLTKYASFEALKRAANAATEALTDKQKLNLEARQAASILSTLRLQRQQKDAPK